MFGFTSVFNLSASILSAASGRVTSLLPTTPRQSVEAEPPSIVVENTEESVEEKAQVATTNLLWQAQVNGIAGIDSSEIAYPTIPRARKNSYLVGVDQLGLNSGSITRTDSTSFWKTLVHNKFKDDSPISVNKSEPSSPEIELKREAPVSEEKKEEEAEADSLLEGSPVAELAPSLPEPLVAEVIVQDIAAPLPVEIETSSVEVETPLIEVEASPVESETSPVEVEASLVESEVLPVEPEASPVEVEASPVEVEVSPVESEASPAESEASPVEFEASTAESEASPIESEASTTESEVSLTAVEPSPVEAEQEEHFNYTEKLSTDSQAPAPRAAVFSTPLIEEEFDSEVEVVSTAPQPEATVQEPTVALVEKPSTLSDAFSTVTPPPSPPSGQAAVPTVASEPAHPVGLGTNGVLAKTLSPKVDSSIKPLERTLKAEQFIPLTPPTSPPPNLKAESFVPFFPVTFPSVEQKSEVKTEKLVPDDVELNTSRGTDKRSSPSPPRPMTPSLNPKAPKFVPRKTLSSNAPAFVPRTVASPSPLDAKVEMLAPVRSPSPSLSPKAKPFVPRMASSPSFSAPNPRPEHIRSNSRAPPPPRMANSQPVMWAPPPPHVIAAPAPFNPIPPNFLHRPSDRSASPLNPRMQGYSRAPVPSPSPFGPKPDFFDPHAPLTFPSISSQGVIFEPKASTSTYNFDPWADTVPSYYPYGR